MMRMLESELEFAHENVGLGCRLKTILSSQNLYFGNFTMKSLNFTSNGTMGIISEEVLTNIGGVYPYWC